MKKLIKGGRIWCEDHSFAENCGVVIEEGLFTELCKTAPNENDFDEIIDATGYTVLPGLVDVHTHGRAGYDFSTATKEQMLHMKREYAKTGVTALFPTLASATEEDWHRSIADIKACGFDGIHFEGRFLNPGKRGAHAPTLLVPLDAAELERYLKNLDTPCHLSAAFELDTDGSFAACAKSYGATLGLGHTAATVAETKQAMARGVTSFTHLYNAMPPLHHREGGPVCVALSSDAWVEVIADGLHICPDMVAFAYRCKNKDRFVLITDSMEATGCPDGDYAIAGQKVIVKNGRAETSDGALAGSTLSLWNGVQNLIKFADADFADAVACATINPAQMVGIDQSVGSIAVGKRADLLLVDSQMKLCAVYAAGELVTDRA